MKEIKKIKLFDVYIHDLNMDEAVERIATWCHEDNLHHIITADAYMVETASHHNELRNIINNASLVTPDSSGVILASKLYGDPILNKTSGCEMAENLCKISGDKNIRIFFLGAKPEVVTTAVNKMKEKYPDVQIAGSHHGYFNEDENDNICQMIKDSNSHLLFVAFGIPKQEFWIKNNLHKTGAKVAIGIGGTFDVMSGIVNRAPVIYQKLYLEWLYRYFQDPTKSYKLKKLPAFFIKAILRKGK